MNHPSFAGAARFLQVLLLTTLLGCLLLECQWISAHIAHHHESIDVTTTTTAKPGVVADPHRYIKLKYDRYFAPISIRFQKKYTYQEEEQDKIWTADGRSIDSPVTYYTNPAVDIGNITEDDLILESMNRVYLTRYQQNNLLDYARLEDRRRSSYPKLVSRDRCIEEIGYLVDRTVEMHNARIYQDEKTRLSPELAILLNSYGADEPGVLQGNFQWFGYWEECARRHIFDLQNESSVDNHHFQTRVTNFRGRSCFVSIKNPIWPEKIRQKVKKLKDIDYFKYQGQAEEYMQFFKIQVGVCLPESCDTNILMDHVMTDEKLKQIFKRLVMHKIQEPFSDYNITSVFCLPDESSPLRELDLSGWLFVLVTLGWCCMCVVATLAHHYDLVDLEQFKAAKRKITERSYAQKLVISLSLIESYNNWYKFDNRRKKKLVQVVQGDNSAAAGAVEVKVEQKAKPRMSDLLFLNAIKVMLMPIILTGHISLLNLLLSKRPLDFDLVTPIEVHILCCSAFFVDWYFCITAFITAYCLFSVGTVKTNTWIQWLYSLFHRYWRLMPSYLYLFWFGRSVFHLTGSGALWDYGTSDVGQRAVCQRESWLVPLTLTPNFHPLYEECIMPAWYIGADMQFYMITPLLLLAINKSAKLGYLWVTSLITGSCLLRGWRYYVDEHVMPVDLIRLRTDATMRNNWDISDTYLLPHYRISSYLVGLLAGHYTYMVRSGQWSSPLYSGPKAERYRRIMGLVALQLAVCFLFITWIDDVIYPRDLEPYARGAVVVIYSISFTLAALAPTMLTVTFCLGCWPRVKQWLERPIWTRLARINFFVFLFQVDVMYWVMQTAKRQSDSDRPVMPMFAMLMPALYVLAFFATVLLSNPLARLEAELLGVHMMGKGPQLKSCFGAAGGQDPTTTGGNGEATRLVGMQPAAYPGKESKDEEQDEQQQQQPANGDSSQEQRAENPADTTGCLRGEVLQDQQQQQ